MELEIFALICCLPLACSEDNISSIDSHEQVILIDDENKSPGRKIIKSMPVPKYIFGPGPKQGFRARNFTELARKHIFGPGGVIIWPQKTFSGQPPINRP